MTGAAAEYRAQLAEAERHLAEALKGQAEALRQADETRKTLQAMEATASQPSTRVMISGMRQAMDEQVAELRIAMSSRPRRPAIRFAERRATRAPNRYGR